MRRSLDCAWMLFLLSGIAHAEIPPGPVAAYSFDEGAGTTLLDASGNGFNGTLANGPIWTTGRHGSALQFDATDDGNDDNDPRVVLGRAINIPDPPLTISAWVNPTDYVDYRAIISKRDSGSEVRLDLGLAMDSGHVYLWNGGLNSFSYAPPVNSWTYLAVVADGSGTRLYVNGTLQETIGAIALGTNASANTVIGGTGEGPGGYNDPFKGKIDDLRIYNRALSAAEIQADMNATVVPVAPETIPPTTPTGLAAGAVNGAQIDLAWTASSDNVWVAGYRIERCQGAGCSDFVQVGTATSNSFSNAGLAPLTAYSYRVRAVDPAGNLGSYSNVASASTSAVIPPGPVAAYSFDEGAGTTLLDASGNGFNGTLANGPVWTTGRHGSALQFDATDDGNDDNDPRVVLGRAINIPDPPLTISAWVNPTDYADYRAIVSKRDTLVASDMRLDVGLLQTTGQVYLWNGGLNSFSYAPPVNTWTHLAVVADTDSTRLYVNGALQETIGAIALGTNASANTVIGGTGEGPGGDNDPFKGKIDDLRIYNRALNAAEIQADMNAPALSVSLAPQGSSGTVTVTALALGQGSSGTLTVTISPARTIDTSVSIATSAASVASVPASVIVPAGSANVPLIVTAVAPGTADVTATLNGSSATIQVVVSPAVGVSVDNSIPGSIVASDNTSVSGTFSGPSNTGITVNGIVAAIIGNTFVVPDVPLQPGVNTLTVVLTTPGGQTTTSTISVTSTGPAPIQVSASPAQGVAPLGVTFTINNRTHNAIQSVQADYSGTGSLANVNPNLLLNNYLVPGIYQARFIITDSTGATYQQTVPIAVQDPAQIDQMLRTTWSGFTTTLAAQDTTQALLHFNAQAQTKYGPVLSALLPSLPQIVASFSAPQLMSVSGQVGEYVVSRTINGVNQNFFIYFARDSDGVWRLDSM